MNATEPRQMRMRRRRIRLGQDQTEKENERNICNNIIVRDLFVRIKQKSVRNTKLLLTDVVKLLPRMRPGHGQVLSRKRHAASFVRPFVRSWVRLPEEGHCKLAMLISWRTCPLGGWLVGWFC